MSAIQEKLQAEQQACSEAEQCAIAELEMAEVSRQRLAVEAEARLAQEAQLAAERAALAAAEEKAKVAATALELSKADQVQLDREQSEAQTIARDLLARISDRGDQHEEWRLRATAVLAESTTLPAQAKSGARLWTALAAGLALFIGVAGWNFQQDVMQMFAPQTAVVAHASSGSLMVAAPATMQMSYALASVPAE